MNKIDYKWEDVNRLIALKTIVEVVNRQNSTSQMIPCSDYFMDEFFVCVCFKLFILYWSM